MSRILVVISYCLLAYGCSGNTYLAQKDSVLEPESDHGLVILAVNLTGAPKGFRYIIRSEYDDKPILVPEYGLLEASLPMLKSDYDEVIAKLVVLKLKSGQYRFTEWYTSYSNQYGDYETSSKQDFPIYFDVIANKATYIGEIYQDNKHSGFSISDSKLYIVDSSDRDIPYFLEQYRNIKEKDVIESLAYKNEK